MRRSITIALLILSIMILSVFSLSAESYAEPDTVEAKEAHERAEKKYVSEDGIVHLQREMDIVDLIKAVSEINEEVYLIEDDIKPKEVSIITPEAGMEKEEVLRLFEIILNMNGLTIVKTQGINKVVYITDIAGESTPVEGGR